MNSITLAQKIYESERFLKKQVGEQKFNAIVSNYKNQITEIHEKLKSIMKTEIDYLTTSKYIQSNIDQNEKISHVDKIYKKGFVTLACFYLMSEK